MANPADETSLHGGAKPSLREMANAIRALSMDAVEAANSGHPGMPMGMADVAAVLFTKFMKFDASAPGWPTFLARHCSTGTRMPQPSRSSAHARRRTAPRS